MVATATPKKPEAEKKAAPLYSLESHPSPSVVKVGEDVAFGGRQVTIIAGPCAVESREQTVETARHVRDAGMKVLRGGAYKPRTSPYSFQGLGREGLAILEAAKRETGLKIITEAMDVDEIARVAETADIVQLGSRNMQNFSLLKRAGQLRKPVLLKRGASATLDEFLLAAEYILSEGNPDVILCERGIRTFDNHSRNTLDLNIIPVLKEKTHLPVIVDPSHGTGRRGSVIPMARAAVAAGADGLIVEVHYDPASALCDGKQSLRPSDLRDLVRQCRGVAEAIGRTL